MDDDMGTKIKDDMWMAKRQDRTPASRKYLVVVEMIQDGLQS
jgi:hypothetical protein